MCFVRGRILGVLANSSAPRLSSKALQYTVGTVLAKIKLFSFSSSKRFITGITSLSDWDRLTYSASVVLSATWVYNFDVQIIGQPAYITMNPVRDFVVLASNSDVIFDQFSENQHLQKLQPICFYLVLRLYLYPHYLLNIVLGAPQLFRAVLLDPDRILRIDA